MSNLKRRKAIDCKLVKESKSYSGYFKYIVTVEDIDGSVTKHPSYGVDMQDAIKRLVRSQNADKVVEVVEKKQQFFLLALFAFCVLIPLLGIISSDGKNNFWLILPLITIILLFFLYEILENFRRNKFLDKKNPNKS